MFPYQDINEVYELSTDELSKYLDWSTKDIERLVHDLDWMAGRYFGFLRAGCIHDYCSNKQVNPEQANCMRDTIRSHALNLAIFLSEIETSYGLLAEFQFYFTELGEAYDLLDEFKENALC